MHLSKISIDNFRGFEHIEVDLDSTTVLIGENNTGKSSILEAIRFCLSRALSRRGNPFEDHDYFLPKARWATFSVGMASLLLLRENRPSPGKTLSVHTEGQRCGVHAASQVTPHVMEAPKKSGDATTTGPNSPAVTGEGNQIQYNQTPPDSNGATKKKKE